MATIKKLLISVLYWWLLIGFYFFFTNCKFHSETIGTIIDHLYFGFVYLWHVHLGISVILALFSYLLHLIIRRT